MVHMGGGTSPQNESITLMHVIEPLIWLLLALTHKVNVHVRVPT